MNNLTADIKDWGVFRADKPPADICESTRRLLRKPARFELGYVPSAECRHPDHFLCCRFLNAHHQRIDFDNIIKKENYSASPIVPDYSESVREIEPSSPRVMFWTLRDAVPVLRVSPSTRVSIFVGADCRS